MRKGYLDLSCNLISIEQLPFNHLFAPFYSPVLEPNADLSLTQLEFIGQLYPLTTRDVLAAHKFPLHSLQLS